MSNLVTQSQTKWQLTNARLICIPMYEANYKEELNLIRDIARQNGYNPKISDTIVRKMKRVREIAPYWKKIKTKTINETINS